MEARNRSCRIAGREDLGAGYWRLRAEWPELAQAAAPGGFAMLRCGDGVQPLLRRPFSVADVDEDAGTVSFLGKAIGPGTRYLGALGSGRTLEIVAPLGRGFDWEAGAGGLHVMVAGGIGIAPFPLLARRLAEAGERALLLFGGRTAADLVAVDDFEGLGISVRSIVQSGPGGTAPAGLVTDLLETLLAEESSGLRFYSCGPTPMLRAVGSRLLEAGLPHQTALEAYMACGFGVCIGCAVPVRDGEGGTAYERCCVEGPVFDYARLAW